jgi:hypothetical protein
VYLNSVAIAICAFLRHVMIEKAFLEPYLFIYLDPLYHKGIRLALEAFAICKTENILCWVRIQTFPRDINTAAKITALRILTNEAHPTRHNFINKNTHDEHTEHFGNLDKDVQKIEKTPSTNDPLEKGYNTIKLTYKYGKL